MAEKGTRSWQDSSPSNTTNSTDTIHSIPPWLSSSKTNTDSEVSNSKKRDSTTSLSVWSSSSYKGRTPSSPSPKCSSFSQLSNSPASLTSDFIHPQPAHTPMNKNSGGFNEMKEWVSSIGEIEEERTTLNLNLTSQRDSRGKKSIEEESNTDQKFVNAGKQPHVGMTLGLPGEGVEEKKVEGLSSSSNPTYETKQYSSSILERRSSSRPRSYSSYIDEFEQKQREDRPTGVKGSVDFKLMEKQRRKEAAIKEWELKQTNKADKKKKETEAKLEKKKAKALKEKEKETKRTNKKADKKKAKERKATEKKISRMSSIADKIKATKSGILTKCLSFF